VLVNDGVSERLVGIDCFIEETKVSYRILSLFPFNQRIISIFYRLRQLTSNARRMGPNHLKLLASALCAAVRH